MKSYSVILVACRAQAEFMNAQQHIIGSAPKCSTSVFRHHAGGIKLKLQSFLISPMDGDKWSVARPHHLYSGRATGSWHDHKGKYLTVAF
jgi:hypothetical protein